MLRIEQTCLVAVGGTWCEIEESVGGSDGDDDCVDDDDDNQTLGIRVYISKSPMPE